MPASLRHPAGDQPSESPPVRSHQHGGRHHAFCSGASIRPRRDPREVRESPQGKARWRPRAEFLTKPSPPTLRQFTCSSILWPATPAIRGSRSSSKNWRTSGTAWEAPRRRSTCRAKRLRPIRRLRVLQELGKSTPGYSEISDYQRELAATHQNLGDIQSSTQKFKEALSAYEQALAIRRKLAIENPAVTDDQVDLARVLCVLGKLQDRSGDTTGAIDSFKKAIERQSSLVEMSPSAKPYLRDLSQQYGELARLQRKAKQPSEAIASYRQARDFLEKLPPSTGEDWQNMAAVRAATAALIGDGKNDLGAELQAQKTREEEQAANALRQAAIAGFDDLDLIRKNDDYAPLRRRPEFNTMLDEVEKKGKVLVWNQDLEAAKCRPRRRRKTCSSTSAGRTGAPMTQRCEGNSFPRMPSATTPTSIS